MKSFLEEANFKTIRQRIENLQPTAQRQWGKMELAQMLAHCSVPIEQATNVVPFKDESNFLSKTLIRWIVLRNIKQGGFGKNLPTVPSFVVADERQFEAEKQRLLKNVDLFYQKGREDALNPHPSFGKFSSEQWGGLQYIHLDHHLKQFSA
jgi:hypothetical protein